MHATVGTEPTKLVAAPEISTAQKTCHAHPLSHRRPARVKATGWAPAVGKSRRAQMWTRARTTDWVLARPSTEEGSRGRVPQYHPAAEHCACSVEASVPGCRPSGGTRRGRSNALIPHSATRPIETTSILSEVSRVNSTC
jgi:hypothetical protein